MPGLTNELFFVVGCPRSGTTLMSVLLDRHSRLCVPPETGFFDEVAPRLRRRHPDALRRILLSWRRLPELGLDVEAVLARLGDRPFAAGDVLLAILDLYARGRNKVRCGEKTPQHLMHVPTLLERFPQAKILCMLRDGRDVALSLRAMPWMVANDVRVHAKLWIKCVRVAEQLARKHPQRFRVVRYEALVTHPEEALCSAMEFLDERFEAAQLDPAIGSGVVLPRSMSWKGKALQQIDPHRIGWRHGGAGRREAASLERTLHDDLVRLGYMDATRRSGENTGENT